MRGSDKDQELVEAVKEVFRSKCGEFRLDEFMRVAKLLGLEVWEKRKSGKPMKMYARNYRADICGVNIQWVLDECLMNTSGKSSIP